MIRTLLAVGLCGAALAAGGARERVVALLSGIHDGPTRSALEAASADARAQVRDIARDPKVVGPVKLRALEALRHWPDDAALAIHLAALRDPLLLHPVLRGLGLAFGERALPALREHLASKDPQVRATALEATADVPGDAARSALLAGQATEARGWVQRRFAAALARQGTRLR